jgi:hypothetical protein
MEEEFTISSGWKFFYGLFACGIAIGGVFILKFAFTQTPIALVPAVVILSLAVLVGGQLRKKIIISADRIAGTNILQTRELLTSNVKGCRIGPKTIVIEPDSTAYSKIIINNYSDFDSSEDLVTWLKQNFKDLDATELEAEHDRVLQDTSLGATKEERETKIKLAKWIAGIYSAVGLVAGFASIPFDKEKAVVIILIVYPLIGIFLMARSHGLIKFLSNPRRSIYSFIFLGLFVPVMSLCLGAAMGYNVYQYTNVYIPAAVLGLAIAGLFYLKGVNEDIPSVAGQVVMMLLTAAVYSYGTVVKINCLFDETPPVLSHTTVNSKYKEYNKGEHYYIWLNPFSPGGSAQQIEVGPETYSKYNAGDNIDIELKKGLFNIPWYYLADEN